MQTVKLIYNWIEMIFGAFWIATLFDYLSIVSVMQYTLQEAFNSYLHSLFLAGGFLFFMLGGWYKHNLKKEELKSKKIANRRAELELDNIEFRRKKN